jgi:hypothetical protein
MSDISSAVAKEPTKAGATPDPPNTIRCLVPYFCNGQQINAYLDMAEKLPVDFIGIGKIVFPPDLTRRGEPLNYAHTIDFPIIAENLGQAFQRFSDAFRLAYEGHCDARRNEKIQSVMMPGPPLYPYGVGKSA